MYQSVLKEACFSGKRIMVTGGGSGIGRCIAHELASLGAEAILVGRTESKLRAVSEEILDDGGAATWAVCDIRDEERVQETIREILEGGKRLDGLVNNAGGQFPAPLALINQKGFETVVRTNLVGGFLMAREAYSQCMSEHGGAIVNITADHHGGMPGMGHSGAARAGMENFTRTAAYEWASSGVRVNAVAPGWIASSGMDTYDGMIKAIIPTLKESIPLRRMGTEAEVSAAVCFLLSEGANFISGATLRVDGAASVGNLALWPLVDARNSVSFNGFHRAVTPKVLAVAEESKHKEGKE